MDGDRAVKQYRLKSYVAAICVALLCGSSYAATTDAQTQQLQQISVQMNQLQSQVNSLKKQLAQQKAVKKTSAKAAKATTTVQATQASSANLQPVQHSQYFGPQRFLNGITVTTAPWVGRSAFDASDLPYEISSMKEDLWLLEQRQALEHDLNQVGDSLDNRAVIELSGGLEGQAIYDNDFSGPDQGSIALSTAEIDIVPMVSTWASGFFSLDYNTQPASTGSRNPIATIYLKRGFLTIGNLDKSPIYFSMGQMYPAFGRYSSALLTAPLTLSMMRILAPTMDLGFIKNGYYASIFGYEGNTNNGNDFIHEGGADLGYKNATNYGAIQFGVSYDTNIADSQGMQNNGLSTNNNSVGPTQFAGFQGTSVGANNTDPENLQHTVGGGDAHLELGYHNWYIVTEFMSALNRFAAQDLTYNGQGALPAALHTEVDYTWHLTHPWTLGVAYGQSWDALALNLPQNSYWVLLSTSLWKDTVEGIEYRHDSNYAVQPSANVTGSGLPVPDANVGGTRNMVTLQIGVYF